VLIRGLLSEQRRCCAAMAAASAARAMAAAAAVAPAGRELAFKTAKSLWSRPGASRGLGKLLSEQGCRSALFVTGPCLRRLGVVDGALASLHEHGVAAEVFDAVEADPANTTVDAAVAAAREVGAGHIVGFGGGSAMDVAKLVACLAAPSCTQALDDMYGVEMVSGERLPLTLVPTTAGSGSEVTSISIIKSVGPDGEPMKKAVVSAKLLPDCAVLDAELTLELPTKVTADSGVDAMVHCIEAFTSRIKKNPIADALAKEGLRLLSGSIRTSVVSNPQDVEARAEMLLGACLAGMAFNISPVGAVHALAYPLGSHFGISHGLSNSLVLPQVLEFNRGLPEAGALYAELLPQMHGTAGRLGGVRAGDDAAAALINEIRMLQHDLNMPTRLTQVGLSKEDIPLLAREAMKQTRLLPNNVREIHYDDAEQIYAAVV